MALSDKRGLGWEPGYGDPSAQPGGLDLSNPSTFFALAPARGWGAGNRKYLKDVQNVYDVVRRSAAATEERP